MLQTTMCAFSVEEKLRGLQTQLESGHIGNGRTNNKSISEMDFTMLSERVYFDIYTKL